MTQEELKVKLTEWRHYLHTHPELSLIHISQSDPDSHKPIYYHS